VMMVATPQAPGSDLFTLAPRRPFVRAKREIVPALSPPITIGACRRPVLPYLTVV
jgi:hypothetical protein